MRRSLLILLALLVVTWFEFQIYPGHTYLQGETQLLVPMLERLDAPGFLSRDLVASNPTFAYTIYDEITQLLHAEGRLSFEQALLRQQIFFRFAAIVGIFLCARALKVAPLLSVILSGAVNCITQLTAPFAFVTNPEPTPASFALSLVFLAAGLMVNRNALLGGLAAGMALLYEPMTALAFWLVLIVAWLADKPLRRFLRPAWFSLLIFGLILGNLVQLQAGLGGGQELTAEMSAAMVHLTQIRTPWTWVSIWATVGIWNYLFVLVCGIWALARIWTRAERLTRWMIAGLLLSGIASVGVAAFLLATRMQIAVEMPASRNLAFTVAMSMLLCGAAACQAALERKWNQTLPWAALLVAAVLNAQVLDLFHGRIAAASRPRSVPSDVQALAAWAEQNTWGSSMFQFLDAGEGNQPGMFRALSRRALWADWQSGLISDYSDKAGQEWWSRWQSSISGSNSSERLKRMLAQPIDYYVLPQGSGLAGAKPVFQNSGFVVFDAQDLREARR